MWLLGSSSPMLSNERNPLTFISRWSSLAPASTSRILQTLLVHVSGHLVTSHWPLLPINIWIMLYTSMSIQSSSPYFLGWWQRGVGLSCKIQFLHKLGHILLFVLLCWGCYSHWSHNMDLLVFQVIIFHDNSVDKVHSSFWINYSLSLFFCVVYPKCNWNILIEVVLLHVTRFQYYFWLCKLIEGTLSSDCRSQTLYSTVSRYNPIWESSFPSHFGE